MFSFSTRNKFAEVKMEYITANLSVKLESCCIEIIWKYYFKNIFNLDKLALKESIAQKSAVITFNLCIALCVRIPHREAMREHKALVNLFITFKDRDFWHMRHNNYFCTLQH